jgi:nicotinamide-nucleotide amidase
MSTQVPPQTIAFLAIGDELLDGAIHDANLPALAAYLLERGQHVAESAATRDEPEAIARVLRALSARHDLVICSGGLGPTLDDRTRAAIATVAGVPIERRDDVVMRLEEKFARRGRPMTPPNLRQADVPKGATLVPSAVGTADPFSVPVGNAVVACLPGVPHEFRALLPALLDPLVTGSKREATALVRLNGIGESSAASRVEALALPAVALTYLATFPTVTIGIHGASSEVRDAADAIRAALAPWTLPEHARSPEAALLSRAIETETTLAVAESCTAGGIAEAWTRVAGASSVFVGGIVAYHERAKIALLDVAPETIARESVYSVAVAREMAEGARRRFNVDLAVSTTGVAGPGTPEDDPPVGTVFIGIASAAQSMVAHAVFAGRSRAAVRAATVSLATRLADAVLGDAVESILEHDGVQSLTRLPSPRGPESL